MGTIAAGRDETRREVDFLTVTRVKSEVCQVPVACLHIKVRKLVHTLQGNASFTKSVSFKKKSLLNN